MAINKLPPSLAKGGLLPDPALPPEFQYGTVVGPLFENGADEDDVFQGGLGDCFLNAAMSALAHQRPDLVEQLVEQKPDGTYVVHLRELDAAGQVKVLDVPLDADLPVNERGELAFSSGAATELWPALVEKGFAHQYFQKDYVKLGQGWKAAFALELLSGLPGQRIRITDEMRKNLVTTAENRSLVEPREILFDTLAGLLSVGAPIVASTFSTLAENPAGIIPNHCYTILQVFEENGQRHVELRNPWGQDAQGKPRDGANDGRLVLTLEEFTQLFQDVDYVRPPVTRRVID
jgi:hypothetical protein